MTFIVIVVAAKGNIQKYICKISFSVGVGGVELLRFYTCRSRLHRGGCGNFLVDDFIGRELSRGVMY